jgi:hypothetical protein
MADVNPSTKPEPIGLTVYDLPSPMDAAVQDASRTRAGRVRLLLVLLVCAAPVLLSYLTYYVIRPQGTSSFGQLIDPQRDLPAITATDLQAQRVDLRSLRGQWLFVVVAGGACGLDCESLLYVQRQLHKSLGKEQDKVERVWLVPDAAPVAPQLVQALQGATVLRVDAQALSQWLSPAEGRQLSDHLYLVDPMGRWMMRFPPHPDAAAASKIKRDLERLLRAANSWDQPGR